MRLDLLFEKPLHPGGMLGRTAVPERTPYLSCDVGRRLGESLRRNWLRRRWNARHLFSPSRSLYPDEPVVDPEQQRCGDAHRDYRPPDESRTVHLLPKMMHKPAAQLAGNERSDAQRK